MYELKSRTLPTYYGAVADVNVYPLSPIWTTASYLPKVGDSTYWSNQYEYYKALRSKWYLNYSQVGSERIEWQSNGRDKMNPCLHIKSGLYSLPYHVMWKSSSTRWYQVPYYRVPAPNIAPFTLAQLVEPIYDYQAARARAWHNMQPEFEGRVSMLNFLFELKDFRDIARNIFNYKQTIKRLRRTFVKLKSSNKPSIRPLHGADPTAEIATGILINNFTIQPLIKDITAMIQQFNIIVSEAQAEFNDMGSDLQKSHYSEVLDRVASLVPQTGGNAWRSSGTLKKTTFTATLRYTYDYSMRNNFRAWMKYWGLCGSFEAFWNMIPFSFLADYVIGIGNSISAMEHDPNVDLTQHGYCESIKTQWMSGTITNGNPIGAELVLDGNYIMNGTADLLLTGVQGSIYRRRPTEPYTGPASPKWKLPSGTQALNCAALLRCLL